MKIAWWMHFMVALATAGHAAAQNTSAFSSQPLLVGSEEENYLRILQDLGNTPAYPWSIAPFSARELRVLLPLTGVHPWGSRLTRQAAGENLLTGIFPRFLMIGNSAFPYGRNDGPVWAGRGLTFAVSAGVYLRASALSVAIAPQLAWSQNASFQLMDNGLTGRRMYADGEYFDKMDRPQRFGSGPYRVADPGQSFVRADFPWITVGVSTANQRWGPATEYPVILGNNAAGFPHVFLGTPRPLDLWLFRLHARVVYGILSQSPYSPVTRADSRRFMSGIVALIIPRGVPNLELGGSRFYHTDWMAGGLTFQHFTKPVESLLKVNLPGPLDSDAPKQDLSNQLASIFFRWVFPRSGLELYGEYGREDHSWDLRDLILEPDHSAGYMLGLRKVWIAGRSNKLFSLTAEVIDLQPSTLTRGRLQDPFYVHAPEVTQGHTQRGQILGADIGTGGAAVTVTVDEFRTDGRWSFAWSRNLRQDRRSFLETGITDSRALDVVHSLTIRRLLFFHGLDVSGGVTAAYEFNRDYLADAFNLNIILDARVILPSL